MAVHTIPRPLQVTTLSTMALPRHALWTFTVASAVAAMSSATRVQPEMEKSNADVVVPDVSLAEEGCTVVPNVDRHLLRNGMDVSLRPLLGWTISPGCGPGAQTGASGTQLLSSSHVFWRESKMLLRVDVQSTATQEAPSAAAHTDTDTDVLMPSQPTRPAHISACTSKHHTSMMRAMRSLSVLAHVDFCLQVFACS